MATMWTCGSAVRADGDCLSASEVLVLEILATLGSALGVPSVQMASAANNVTSDSQGDGIHHYLLIGCRRIKYVKSEPSSTKPQNCTIFILSDDTEIASRWQQL